MKIFQSGILLFLCVPVFAQDGPDGADGQEVLDEVANRIVLEDQAKTVEEVRKRLRTQHDAANRHAIANLERIARTAVSKGDIAAAAEAWEEVLSLDLTHEGAANFFKTIGRDEYKPKRSDNRNVWVNAENPNSGFMHTRTGWIELTPHTRGGRVAWKEVGRTENVIVLENSQGRKGRLHRDAWYWQGKNDSEWRSGVFGRWIR